MLRWRGGEASGQTLSFKLPVTLAIIPSGYWVLGIGCRLKRRCQIETVTCVHHMIDNVLPMTVLSWADGGLEAGLEVGGKATCSTR